jgi:hypothetical protein
MWPQVKKYMVDFTFYGTPMTAKIWTYSNESDLDALTAQRRIAYQRNLPPEDFVECHVINVKRV